MTYELMVYINSGLISICVILMGAVAWYFRKDVKISHEQIAAHDGAIDELRHANMKTNKNIELTLIELRNNKDMDNRRMDMMMSMIKIISKKTKTDVGI